MYPAPRKKKEHKVSVTPEDPQIEIFIYIPFLFFPCFLYNKNHIVIILLCLVSFVLFLFFQTGFPLVALDTLELIL